MGSEDGENQHDASKAAALPTALPTVLARISCHHASRLVPVHGMSGAIVHAACKPLGNIS
jgi:hypothetical protein